MKKKLLILTIILLIVIATLFSIIKFHVYNPVSSFSGMIQILFTDKEYVIVQNHPNKVIFSKPDTELLDRYMSENGYEYIEEEQMGSMLVYKNDTDKDTIQFSINKYYSKWEWQ